MHDSSRDIEIRYEEGEVTVATGKLDNGEGGGKEPFFNLDEYHCVLKGNSALVYGYQNAEVFIFEEINEG
jgi:hypothetical protein